MNILLFNGGTSHKNTEMIAKEYKRKCEARGHSVVLLDEYFKDCLNCSMCVDSNKCCIPDSLTKTLSENRFDVITIATPIYFFHMSSKAKAFLDRLYPINKENLIFSLLCISGSSYEDSGIDLVEESMYRVCDFCGSYLAPTFYKTTNDTFTRELTDNDIVYLKQVIDETEALLDEIKESI